ncbi:MAG: tRNA-specific adenosine deaminase [Flavobacteriaceae bacterium]|nr:tRNA-specific adenosine deaminase [Flavobacteriaceae bacterium]
MESPFDDYYYMKKAMAEAKLAFEKDEVPVGALIVSKQQIIAKSHNLTELLCDVTAHAEMQAITAAANYLGAKYLRSCTLYVTLEPCQMCAGALYWSQIGKVVYAAEDPKRGYRAMGARLHPRTQVDFGILGKESRKLLREFFDRKRL